jgi:pantoate--beta-alanine ligase
MLIVEHPGHRPLYHHIVDELPGTRVVLVPTMGNLHTGHLTLIRNAKALGDMVVVSIFVNPTQFGPTEDFDRYPRTREADLVLCREADVDVVWLPSVAMMYPEGLEPDQQFAVIPPRALTQDWCGAHRPGHFAGVGLIVAKLFQQIRPHVAVFGEKDAQQLALIRRLVRDFDFPIEIVAHPTVREADGLALSSRNQYLVSAEERQAALALSQVMTTVQRLYAILQTTRPGQAVAVEWAFEQAMARCSPSWPCTVPIAWDYQGAVDNTSFERQTYLSPGSRLLVAARIGSVRLIDTMALISDA